MQEFVCRKINGPFLVIGTKSVVSSWMDEFKTFCPDMKVLPVFDRNSSTISMETLQWDVCVTTFDVISKNPLFLRYQWHYVVIDEAHKLRNENTIFGKFIRRMPAKHRLLLTGTPLQNNLHELWLLLNYLMPDIFNSPDVFDGYGEENAKLIQAILKPFFLRRVKADVEASLLPKIEKKLFVGVTKLQRDIYIKTLDDLVLQGKSSVCKSLRKISNHPYLIRGVEPGPPYHTYGTHLITTSGKMLLLHKLLQYLHCNKSRVLLFSQFVDMLDIIEDYLTWQKYNFRRLDGRTELHQRAADIDEFNDEHSSIFIYIISTGAGALGEFRT